MDAGPLCCTVEDPSDRRSGTAARRRRQTALCKPRHQTALSSDDIQTSIWLVVANARQISAETSTLKSCKTKSTRAPPPTDHVPNEPLSQGVIRFACKKP